jgi:hypothetical protein
MTCHQAIVWIDSEEACILRVNDGLRRESTIHAQGTVDLAAKSPSIQCSIDAPNGFFHRVARALDMADEILIVGPSAIKVEFVKYMHKNEHALDPRILGVETIERLNDSELAGFAKLYFTLGGPRRAGNGSSKIPAE